MHGKFFTLKVQEHFMQANYGERVKKARASLPKDLMPETAVVLGSGLSGIVNGLGFTEIPFADIAEFPRPTVQGHKGVVCYKGKTIIFAGRFHYYEGNPMDNVVLPIFLMKELGVKNVILTNAAGGINASYTPGDLILIKDHLNMMGTNPFIGPNPSYADGKELGSRFFDMSTTYNEDLRKVANTCAKVLGHKPMNEGVYCALTGPSYETPAEIRMLKTLGADLVGMSTAPEAIAANYLGMKVLGISCVTNMAAGIQATPLNHAEVVEVGKNVEVKLKELILSILDSLA